MSCLRCKSLCIVVSFLVLCSICLSSFFVHYKKGPEYFTQGTDVYLLGEISAVELGFDKFSRSSEIHFYLFFFRLHLIVVKNV